ncbi:MAG: hypothetical protein QOG55_3471 [Acidobacteriaceae bacterium]|nr:hypothetical protein [Acidobacteriaceae bacterium]
MSKLLGVGQRWLRFQEKRGKEHEVPVHSKAREAIDLWLEGSRLASNPAAPLFPAFTEYMNSGGTIEIAQQIAGHESFTRREPR